MAPWGGARVQQLRARWQPAIDRGEIVCWRCGRPIPPGTKWDLDHVVPRVSGHDMWDETNMLPAHAACNRRHGQAISTLKRRIPYPDPDMTPAEKTRWRRENGYSKKRQPRPAPPAPPAPPPDPFTWF